MAIGFTYIFRVTKIFHLDQGNTWYNEGLITRKELNSIRSSELRFTRKPYRTECGASTRDFFEKQVGKDTVSRTFQSSISMANERAMCGAVNEFNRQFSGHLRNGYCTLYTAAVVTDIRTGKIIAHYGSDNLVDLTTMGIGSDMGSVHKPFVACELLESGFDANAVRLYDGPIKGLKTPRDFGQYSYKYMGIDEALAQSRNASFVNIRLITNPIELYKNVERRFREMNIPADPYLDLYDENRREENILNYPLGSRNMRLIDIAQAYQTFFNHGRYIQLTSFHSYYNPYKDSTIEIKQEEKQIYSAENSDRIKAALRHTMLRGGTTYHLNRMVKTRRTMYAKTGTTDMARDGYCLLSDGEILIVAYVTYGQIVNNHLRLGLHPIPFGSGGRSAGVLAAYVYNRFSTIPR